MSSPRSADIIKETSAPNPYGYAPIDDSTIEEHIVAEEPVVKVKEETTPLISKDKTAEYRPDIIIEEEAVDIDNSEGARLSRTDWVIYRVLAKLVATITGHSVKRVFAQLLTWAAVGIEPLFAYFLYMSVANAEKKIASETGIDEVPALGIAVQIVLIGLVAKNLIADLTSVNPVEDAEYLISPAKPPVLKPSDNYYINYETIRKIGGGVSLIATFVGAIPSFANFAASDGVAIADWTDNVPVKYGLTGLVTVLGVSYYMMFSGGKLKQHALELAERIFAKDSTLLAILRSPAISLEVLIQVFSNMGYRSIAAAYIGLSLLHDVLGLPPTHAAVIPYMIVASALTFGTTAMTRVLQVKNYYLNSEFEKLEDTHFVRSTISKPGLIADAIITNTRSAAATWLMSSLITLEDQRLKYSIIAAVGVAINAHGLYVSWKTRRNQAALEYRNTDEAAKKLLPDDGGVSTDEDEISATKAAEPAAPTEGKPAFDELVEYFNSNALNTLLTVVNGGARAARFVGFIGFLLGIERTLADNGIDLGLSFMDTVALAGLWGVPTLVADGRVYEEELRSVWKYYRAKMAIGAPTEEGDKRMAAFRFFSSIFTPKDQFEEEKVQKVLAKLKTS